MSFGIFNIGVAVAKDYQTLMICRFFGGFFGSAPLAITAAVFADMYSNTVSRANGGPQLVADPSL